VRFGAVEGGGDLGGEGLQGGEVVFDFADILADGEINAAHHVPGWVVDGDAEAFAERVGVRLPRRVNMMGISLREAGTNLFEREERCIRGAV